MIKATFPTGTSRELRWHDGFIVEQRRFARLETWSRMARMWLVLGDLLCLALLRTSFGRAYRKAKNPTSKIAGD